MVTLDRQMVFWLLLLAAGIVGFILAFLGEFVFGWWDDVGNWFAWVTGGVTVIAAIAAAGRFQLDAVGKDVKALLGISRDIRANTARLPNIEANTARLPNIEANTARLPNIEASASETVVLLRDIRDRLPPRP